MGVPVAKHHQDASTAPPSARNQRWLESTMQEGRLARQRFGKRGRMATNYSKSARGRRAEIVKPVQVASHHVRGYGPRRAPVRLHLCSGADLYTR